MKKIFLTLLLALSLLLSFAMAQETQLTPQDYLGKPMPDFTVTTIDGESFTLSEAVKSHKAVMVNLWATWCGPCESEFPFIEEAYKAYSEDVAVIALSVEPEDSDELLRQYAQAHGMSFPVASDREAGLNDIFVDQGIPTTVIVDRFGNVVLIEVGSQPSADPFMAMFEKLTGDGYTETQVFDGFPRALPTIEASAEGTLAAAAGMKFYVASSTDEYAWPFLAGEKDGRECIVSSNKGKDDSISEVRVIANAKAGDAFAFRACLSTEEGFDRFSVHVNGQRVKGFSGEMDWFDYAVSLAEGKNEILLRYEKDAMEGWGDDAVYLAGFDLLSGEEAAKALAALPVYPYGEETRVSLLNEGAQRLWFYGPSGTEEEITSLIGVPFEYYIIDGLNAKLSAQLQESCDPEYAFVYSNATDEMWNGYDFLDGPIETVIDSIDTTGYSYTFLTLYNGDEALGGYCLFKDEANANAFEEEMNSYGLGVHYVYDGGKERGSSTVAETAPAIEIAAWAVRFVDQNGAPVPGCIVNFCTDEACVPVVANENGYATFEGKPYPYHLQVIKVPKGYQFDTAQEFTAEPTGGEMQFVVTKAE